MVITNTSSRSFKPDWTIYAERVAGFTQTRNVLTGDMQALNGFEIKANESLVLELVR